MDCSSHSCVVQDDKFNSRSVLSMDRVDILHTICCIEQQLLLEDHSPSIHDPVSSYPSIMYPSSKENVGSLTHSHVGTPSGENAQHQQTPEESVSRCSAEQNVQSRFPVVCVSLLARQQQALQSLRDGVR